MGSIFSSPSSSSTEVCSYDVFTSFHGPDVRKGFSVIYTRVLQAKESRHSMIRRSREAIPCGPELVKAIKESKTSIVVLSKKYASSSWCLDDLAEIVNCREPLGQIVMTIFYDVDPSDVKKQKGDFGKAFEETCKGKTDETKQRWSKALALVATIAREHSLNWSTDAEMIDKITTDVLKNVTPSSEYGEMVRIEAHMNELESVGCDDDAKMLGIWGMQIGDTTSFHRKWSMMNVKGNWKILIGHDEEEQLPKLIKDVIELHFGEGHELSKGESILFLCDDVSVHDRKKLTTQGKELVTLFFKASHSIVTTENKKKLKAYGINNIYYTFFKSKEEDGVFIRRLSSFKKSSVEYVCDKISNEIGEILDDIFD